ncbi:MAG: putative Ig domain-containing protein [Blastocatellia bacterium]
MSGTPLQTGSFPLTITATDRNGCTGGVTYTLVISCQVIVVSGNPLAEIQFEPSQPTQFTEIGGVGSIQYSTSSPLPVGIILWTAGLLSGTPLSSGAFPITITATDVNGCKGSLTVTLKITGLDKCLQNDSGADRFQFSSITGDYLYTRCRDGFTLSGTGVVRLVNGILNLTDTRADRKIAIQYNNAQLTGGGTLNLISGPGVSQTIRITQTNPHAVCGCSSGSAGTH